MAAPTLTDADRAAFMRAVEPFRTGSGAQMAEMYDAIYLAGKAAGAAEEREACAKVCERDDLPPEYVSHSRDDWPTETRLAIAAAIRARAIMASGENNADR
jgi:hypothetical protein